MSLVVLCDLNVRNRHTYINFLLTSIHSVEFKGNYGLVFILCFCEKLLHYVNIMQLEILGHS